MQQKRDPGGFAGTKLISFPISESASNPPPLPFSFNKAKEQSYSFTQLLCCIPSLVCLQHVQLREIRCGEEGGKKPLEPLWALRISSLYF